MAMALTEILPERSILFVESESESLNPARHWLEEDGFAVKTVGYGAAALDAISQGNPGLVLTEISLPDHAGIDILMAVQSNHPDTPVIVITATTELHKAREALRHGAFHYIQKPLAPEDLLALCRRAFETVTLKVENRFLRLVCPEPSRRSHAVGSALRPERAAMERAAFVRVSRFVDQAISQTSTKVLEQALGEPGAETALTDVLADLLLNGSDEGEWAEALLRGAQVQRNLLMEAGGAISASEVGTVLGIGRAAVDKRRRQGTLLGLRLPSGDFVYPAAQFVKNDVVPGLAEVLAAFRIRDPWMQLDALLTRNEALAGRTAFEALSQGDTKLVKEVVSSSGEQGL